MFNCISDTYSFYLGSLKQTNFAVFNITLLVETLLLYVFFLQILASKIAKAAIMILGVFFVQLWLRFYFKFGHSSYIDTCVTIENSTIIILSILYFFQQLTTEDSQNFYNSPRFWIVSAYLIYTAGIYFLFLFIDSLPLSEKEKYYIIINYLFYNVRTILIVIAMFMTSHPKQRKKFQLT